MAIMETSVSPPGVEVGDTERMGPSPVVTMGTALFPLNRGMLTLGTPVSPPAHGTLTQVSPRGWGRCPR